MRGSIAMLKVSVLYPPSFPPPTFNVDLHMCLIHSQCMITANIDSGERGAWIVLQSVPRVSQKIVVGFC